MRWVAWASLAGAVVCAHAQAPLFYGGDGDGRGMLSSEKNLIVTGGSWTFEDFYLPDGIVMHSLWGNFLINYWSAGEVRYEIRSGMSASNGGKLVHSGSVANPTFTLTGRSYFGYPERYIFGTINAPHLPGGLYYVALQPAQPASGRAFVSTTSAEDLGPWHQDPNPPPSGKPLKDGNTFFHSEHFGFNYVATSDPNLLGAGTWDFSYGVGGAPAEPGSLWLLVLGALALQRRR